jgi:hypothetical protein
VHKGIAGGHSVGKATAKNILCAWIWWPTLHKDANEHCQSCDACQRVGNLYMRDGIPLNPQVTLQEFDKWAIDFVGTIIPQEIRLGERYIITTTDYLT